MTLAAGRKKFYASTFSCFITPSLFDFPIPGPEIIRAFWCGQLWLLIVISIFVYQNFDAQRMF
jgi:hypothetical protein